MKKYIKVIGLVIGACLFPLLIDKLIFGNNISSNISNDTWAGFLGSYIGGVSTLLAVFITINDNNKKIEEQRVLEKEAEEEQRKLLLKPYLDTQHKLFDQEASVLENDRVFDIIENVVQKMRYSFTPIDKHLTKLSKYMCLKYSVRNIGAGSAVDVKILINNFPAEIAIAKDETINLYLLVDMKDSKESIFDIKIDYWDAEHRAHYSQKDCLVTHIEGNDKSVEPREHTYPTEI